MVLCYSHRFLLSLHECHFGAILFKLTSQYPIDVYLIKNDKVGEHMCIVRKVLTRNHRRG